MRTWLTELRAGLRGLGVEALAVIAVTVLGIVAGALALAIS